MDSRKISPLKAKRRAMRAVEAMFERYNLIKSHINFSTLDKYTMEHLKLLDATPPPFSTATFSLEITTEYANQRGSMHGGAAGIIFDMATNGALEPVTRKGFWDFQGRVSRTLNISFIKPVFMGTTVHIHSTVIQAGRTAAIIQGKMVSEDRKVVYCICEHHLAAVKFPLTGDGLLFETSWDREMAAEEKEELSKDVGRMMEDAKL